MKPAIVPAVLFLQIFGACAAAQQPPVNDPLLDHLAGEWVLQGTIAGKHAQHDVSAHWVLGHHYLRLHEVARGTRADGQPQYEAIVFIGWDPKPSEYVCLWLDDFGWPNDNAIARAKRSGTEIPFVFNYASSDSPFHTTFAYNAQNDTWELRMDAEEKGKRTPFARARLTRKSAAIGSSDAH